MDKLSLRRIWRRRGSPALACLAAAAMAALPGSQNAASAKDKDTVAYVAPSLDISYWQWVAYGAKTQAAQLGMDYVELTSENSPGTQMNNVRTALTRGVNAIVMGRSARPARRRSCGS